MENKENLIITPKTKISQVINTYPQLEDVLIEYVPTFEKLKNPILRKTIAKITTLQQAAAVGNVRVEDIINRLRQEIGQDLYSDSVDIGYNVKKPQWFSEELIVTEFNAKDMLERGEHPVNQVIADLNNMDNGKLYKLITPFLPAPLIDKALSLKVQHWVEKISDDDFNIYFYK
ncbi:MAG: DUF1858 domain-containing protein, partial [Bacteroidales bacterium]|nr:DUF1858 domain-containing protein [Bacteroidales bacterium]